MIVDRRRFLALVQAASLTACAVDVSRPSDKFSRAIDDVDQIAAGVDRIMSIVVPVSSVTQDVLAAATRVRELSQTIASAGSLEAAKPKIIEFLGLAQRVCATVATVPLLPPQVTLILSAIAVVIPLVEAGIGMMGAARLSFRGQTTLSPSDAHRILDAARR